jgi:rubrerythrin
MDLTTFGAILAFAITLEREAAAYYRRVAAVMVADQRETVSTLAQSHDRRQQMLECIRRENVTEMILEPIYGLHAEEWQVDLSAAGWSKAAELEATVASFYAAAAGKVSIPQVARALRRLGEEGRHLAALVASVP